MKVILIVLDGVGVGSLPDYKEYDPEIANTLVNSLGGSKLNDLPFLKKIGFNYFFDNNMIPSKGIIGKMIPITKDNDTGPIHWEMMGIKRTGRLPLYPNGVPKDIMSQLEKKTGHSFIGNIMVERGDTLTKMRDEHVKTKKPIIYCTTDSVIQVAAMEENIPLDELYKISKTLRNLMPDVGRVIAKPFLINEKGEYERVNRHRVDFMIKPPHKNFLLPELKKNGINSVLIGKIGDIFGGIGDYREIRTGSNKEGVEVILSEMDSSESNFIFANLVDFDMRGHSNDVVGMVKLIKEFDQQLSLIVDKMMDDDLIIITSDHGCDPTATTKTHTREYGILFALQKKMNKGCSYIGGFVDIASTIANYFNIDFKPGNIFTINNL